MQYAVWCDGTYCEMSEINDYLAFMSDDYEVVETEDIDEWLSNFYR